MRITEGVHIAPTLGFGLGRIGAGLARNVRVFGGVESLQVLKPGSSPSSGTCFPCSGECMTVCVLLTGSARREGAEPGRFCSHPESPAPASTATCRPGQQRR